MPQDPFKPRYVNPKIPALVMPLWQKELEKKTQQQAAEKAEKAQADAKKLEAARVAAGKEEAEARKKQVDEQRLRDSEQAAELQRIKQEEARAALAHRETERKHKAEAIAFKQRKLQQDAADFDQSIAGRAEKEKADRWKTTLVTALAIQKAKNAPLEAEKKLRAARDAEFKKTVNGWIKKLDGIGKAAAAAPALTPAVPTGPAPKPATTVATPPIQKPNIAPPATSSTNATNTPKPPAPPQSINAAASQTAQTSAPPQNPSLAQPGASKPDPIPQTAATTAPSANQSASITKSIENFTKKPAPQAWNEVEAGGDTPWLAAQDTRPGAQRLSTVERLLGPGSRIGNWLSNDAQGGGDLFEASKDDGVMSSAAKVVGNGIASIPKAIWDGSEGVHDGGIAVAEGVKDRYNLSSEDYLQKLRDSGYSDEEIEQLKTDAWKHIGSGALQFGVGGLQAGVGLAPFVSGAGALLNGGAKSIGSVIGGQEAKMFGSKYLPSASRVITSGGTANPMLRFVQNRAINAINRQILDTGIEQGVNGIGAATRAVRHHNAPVVEDVNGGDAGGVNFGDIAQYLPALMPLLMGGGGGVAQSAPSGMDTRTAFNGMY